MDDASPDDDEVDGGDDLAEAADVAALCVLGLCFPDVS